MEVTTEVMGRDSSLTGEREVKQPGVRLHAGHCVIGKNYCQKSRGNEKMLADIFTAIGEFWVCGYDDGRATNPP